MARTVSGQYIDTSRVWICNRLARTGINTNPVGDHGAGLASGGEALQQGHAGAGGRERQTHSGRVLVERSTSSTQTRGPCFKIRVNMQRSSKSVKAVLHVKPK